MSVTAIIVVYAVTWFMVFFIVLPLRFVSQGDAGSVVPGTPSSAPAEEIVRRKVRTTTLAATVVWAVICAVILSDVISVRDFDFRGVMDPVPAAGAPGG